MSSELHAAIRELLLHATAVRVVSHIRPDGDAVGSLLGLGLALENSGKQVEMVLNDGVPLSFRHLAGSEKITRSSKLKDPFTVVVDCSDQVRAGQVLEGVVVDLNIDHHVTNLNFGKVNFVQPSAVATAAILTEFLPIWGFEITQPCASALLTGLVSDTLGFRTSNMNPQALRLAAQLMERGANLSELYFQALVKRSMKSAQFWGYGLQRMMLEDQLLWTSLTQEDRQAASYPGNDDADLVNLLSTIDEAVIAIIFVEQKGGQVKISWRSRLGWDVSQLALQFGGGGHPAAAGAEIFGSLEEVQDKVLTATRMFMQEKRGTISPTGTNSKG